MKDIIVISTARLGKPRPGQLGVQLVLILV